MLCQFSVKNYKSIKDEITFDMQATAISEHEDRLIKDSDGELFLPVSAIYGPNGGGKSNVLQSLYTLRSKVLRPLCATCDKKDYEGKVGKVSVAPFFTHEGNESATEFTVFFRTHLSEYRYILHLKQDTILYECLDKIKLNTGRKSGLFERETNKDIKLKGIFMKFKVSDDLSDTLPLLSFLAIAYRKNEIINEIMDWFEDGIEFLNYGNPMQELRMAIVKSEDAKNLILDMISEMDIDIVNFQVREKDENYIEIYTTHKVNDEEIVILLEEESSGTIKLFGLLPFIAKSLLIGTVLVIDELDAKIHPDLLRYIIKLYTDMSVNKHGAQLIFTSHDLSTMNGDNFRRDEIWFAAKGKVQDTQLYSLVEFKNKKGESVRKDAKYDKQYLEGKYGADPYLKKIINWGEVNA